MLSEVEVWYGEHKGIKGVRIKELLKKRQKHFLGFKSLFVQVSSLLHSVSGKVSLTRFTTYDIRGI